MDIFVKVLEGKFESRRDAFEQRKVRVLFGLEIMEGDSGEVAHDEISWNFPISTLVLESVNVLDALCLSFMQVLARAFMFCQKGSGPKEIDSPKVSREIPDWCLKRSDVLAFFSENLEKLVPKCLSFGFFRACRRKLF